MDSRGCSDTSDRDCSWRSCIPPSEVLCTINRYGFLYCEYRINFKTGNIAFNTLHYSQSAYLHSLLCFHTPVRSNTNLLTISFAHTSLGVRSFSVTSHKIYNSLPPALYSCNCPNTFHRHLKTHYFQQAFSPS